MTVLQQHLINNYSKFVSIFTKKFKDEHRAKQAVHNTWYSLRNENTTPNNVDNFLYYKINQKCLKTAQEKRRDVYLTFYKTEKELVNAIGSKEIDVSLEIDSKKIISEHFNKLSIKAQNIISERICNGLGFVKIAKKYGYNYETTKATYRHNMKYLREYVENNEINNR